MSGKILVVDDSEDIREVIEVVLNSEGYEVHTAESGEHALRLLDINHDIDLIILDIMMPGKSGFEICQDIRKATTAPILFLSAKSHIEDKERGLSVGGDDYLLKPFSPIELIARVKALLRRYSVYQGKDQNPKSEIIRIRELLIHPTSGEVWIANRPVSLRHMEYKLLVYLATNRGRILSAQELYESIWQEPFLPVSNNTVVAHIKNLRQQIEHNPKEPRFIITVWGRGYQIV
ncbi:response regulator transcription factor [Paenibacillus sp. YN15]|uniref:response regulator transcription factor n=1 Tax=Paenibacillus sp. YN15 TaxID=1742774 RepID=UPI000DCDDCDC|nr:response regulator transcription factor [Paenibacillus sp. YN15]RAU98634.1 DNA-binding response regulator [Paenibacillus sp. YN15]